MNGLLSSAITSLSLRPAIWRNILKVTKGLMNCLELHVPTTASAAHRKGYLIGQRSLFQITANETKKNGHTLLSYTSDSSRLCSWKLSNLENVDVRLAIYCLGSIRLNIQSLISPLSLTDPLPYICIFDIVKT